MSSPDAGMTRGVVLDRPDLPDGLLVSDAERDSAVAELRDAMATGRLDEEEYERRVGVALAARTGRDLRTVLSGLPVPHPPASAETRSSPGSEPAAPPAADRAPQRVGAHEIIFSAVDAAVEVTVHDRSDVEYVITGSDAAVKAVVVDSSGGRLRFSSPTGSGSSQMQISSRSVVVVNGLRVTGDSAGPAELATVSVKVPRRTAVVGQAVRHRVDVGDTHGPVSLTVQGDPDVRIGQVSAAQLTVQGSSRVTITSVDGPVNATVHGSGDVAVRGGRISRLTLNVMGSGSAHIDATAEHATLTCMGSGAIDVAHVADRSYTHTQMGSGSVRVRRVG